MKDREPIDLHQERARRKLNSTDEVPTMRPTAIATFQTSVDTEAKDWDPRFDSRNTRRLQREEAIKRRKLFEVAGISAVAAFAAVVFKGVSDENDRQKALLEARLREEVEANIDHYGLFNINKIFEGQMKIVLDSGLKMREEPRIAYETEIRRNAIHALNDQSLAERKPGQDLYITRPAIVVGPENDLWLMAIAELGRDRKKSPVFISVSNFTEREVIPLGIDPKTESIKSRIVDVTTDRVRGHIFTHSQERIKNLGRAVFK